MKAPWIFTPEYYERLSELEGGGWWNAAMRDIAALLLSRIGLPEHGLMMDVGCGTGETLRWFGERYPGWEIVGFDVSRAALTRCRGPVGPARVGRASALALPVDSERVDLVWTQDVLQHLPHPNGDREALAEMYRTLRPGGHLLLRTNALALFQAASDPRNAFRRYRCRELRARLASAGFEVLRASRVNALLGVAEIPREMRASRREGRGYHGLLADTAGRRPGGGRWKRAWLRSEGRLVAAGLRLPVGRSIVALCRKPPRDTAEETPHPDGAPLLR